MTTSEGPGERPEADVDTGTGTDAGTGHDAGTGTDAGTGADADGASRSEEGVGDGPAAVDPTLAAVVGLLDDEYARAILAATSVEPLSAAELGDRCGMSRATVYRRLERLAAADLVDERTRPRPDGHHDTVYAATLDSLTVSLDAGEFDYEIDRDEDRTEDAVDRLTRMWEDL